MMIEIHETLPGVPILSFLLYIIKRIKKTLLSSISLPSPPRPTSDSSLIIGRGVYFSSENQVTIKLEKQHSRVNEKEKNDSCCLYEGNILQENRSLETDSSLVLKLGKTKGINLERKRPTSLVIPDSCPAVELVEEHKKTEAREFWVEGKGYILASRKGKKQVMEDSYGVSLNISGDPKQAFFAVIDGHGGPEAAHYVAKHLGKNILKSLCDFEDNEEEIKVKTAIKGGYLTTDDKFLDQMLNGGACVASVLIRQGYLHVANVGDCRVVLSRNGVAHKLTTDHRLSREDERHRIENRGGFVHCRKGVWRVNGSLAVSRAIGDRHLKEWVISEPDIHQFSLDSDCDFLILASDGLWDMVNDQEAVDVVVKGESTQKSCKKLVDISFSRGNKDDITVMVIDLKHFEIGN